MQAVLSEWTEPLAYRGVFPGSVTAFQKDMTLRGRYGESAQFVKLKYSALPTRIGK